MNKHTPAPWEIVIDWEERHPIAIIDPTTTEHPQGTLHICNVNPNLSDESYANARLIAAAPELLDEVKENAAEWEDLIVVLRSNPTWDRAKMDAWITKKAQKAIEAAREAIAKAQG